MDSTKKCSQCGSDDIYFNQGQFMGHAVNLFPKLNGGTLIRSVDVDVYVCGQCGYAMFFLRKKAIAEVKEKWAPIK